MIDTPPWAEISAAAFTTGAALLWLATDRRPGRDVLAPWLLATTVTLVALNGAELGVLFVVAATLLCGRIEDHRLRVALAVAGSAATTLLMTDGIDDRLVLGALVGAAFAAVGLWHVDREHGHAVALIVAGGTAMGMYINVPDTEQVVVFATAVPIMALAMLAFESLRRSPVGLEVLVVLATLLVSSGAVGARGRPESFVGVIGALGVLVGEPIAATVRRGTRAHAAVLVVVHGAAVVVSSRLAGRYGPWSLTTTVAVTLAATTLLLTIAPRVDRPAAPPSDD